MSTQPIPDDDQAPDAEPPFLSIYIASTEKLIARLTAALAELRRAPSDAGALEVLHRGFHSLHGNSSFIAQSPITPLARAGESALKAARTGLLDAADLLAPIAAALDCCTIRLEEYRRHGATGAANPREGELTASLHALMGRGGRTGQTEPAPGRGTRYTYAGHDVTAVLELLAAAQTEAAQTKAQASGLSATGPAGQKLDAARAQLRHLASSIEDQELIAFIDAPSTEPAMLLRLLAQRVLVCP